MIGRTEDMLDKIVFTDHEIVNYLPNSPLYNQSYLKAPLNESQINKNIYQI